MSEPLSTPEIEDVVSSVRRLVSTTQSPRGKRRDPANDKLILTPSLRVVPDVKPEPLPDPIPVPEPELDAVPATVAPVAEETVSQMVPEAPFIEVEAEDTPADAALLLEDAVWEDELWSEPEAPLAELAAEVEDAELVVEPEVEPVVDVWPEAATAAEPWVQTETEWEEETPIPFVHLHRVPAEIPIPQHVPLHDLPAAAAATADPVTASQPEPAPEPELESAVAGEPTLFDEDGNPIAILDEDALHEIVRTLIREELQGVLGERITRNVRKLVRAEINRALAARAYE